MGFLKGLLLSFLSTVLVSFLILGNLSLVIYISTSNANFQDKITEDISNAVLKQHDVESQIQAALPAMKDYCKDHSEILFNSSGFNVNIPCSSVDEGAESVVKTGLEQIIGQEPADGKCDSPINCVLKYKSMIFSEQAVKFWRTTFLVFGFLSLIMLGIMLLIVENKADFPITAGIMILFSSLPLLGIKFMLPYFENSILKPIATLFSAAFGVFTGALALGIALVILGFALKFINRDSARKK